MFEMCLSIMDTKPKHIKTLCPFKNKKPGSKLLLRVTPEEDDAVKPCPASAVRATIRKCLRRQTKRAQLAKLDRVLGGLGRPQKEEAACGGGRPALACIRRHPPQAMAPENTTQYLMSNVYEDMEMDAQAAAVSHTTSTHVYGEALSPGSVYAALDSDHNCDRHLAYQQREFEELYDLCG